MKKLVGIGLGLVLSLAAFAQPGWNYEGLTPEQTEKAQTMMVTLGDDLKAKNYEEAVKKTDWLYETCPKVHKSLYINGAKAYAGMVNKTKGEERNAYEDKTLMMYDKRAEYFGDEANVLNRKGQKAWVYLKDRPEKTEEVFNLYQKIFELNGTKMYAPNTMAYMDMACKMKTAGKMTDEQVIEVNENVNSVLDAHAADPKYTKMREPVGGIFVGCVDVDCDYVKQNLEPKFKANPDIKLAKKMFSLMSSGKCTDDPMFFELMEYIDSKEPSCGMKITMARKAKKAKNFDKSLKYYNAALEACGEEKKAEILYDMATIYKAKGDKVTARSYARKSIAAGSEYKTASYNMIGDMYFGSFQACANSSLVKSRATYIAAYNQYKMAGNNSMMAKAKAQFPSMEEIFTENMKIGQEVTVGCWIGETVKLDKR